MSNPLRAVRAKCLSCMGGIAEPFDTIDGEHFECHRPFKAVKECATTRCALHSYRLGTYAPGTSEKDVLKAIRAFCFGCLAGEGDQVRRGGSKHNRSRPTSLTRLCSVSDCELYALRTGKNPRRAKQGVQRHAVPARSAT